MLWQWRSWSGLIARRQEMGGSKRLDTCMVLRIFTVDLSPSSPIISAIFRCSTTTVVFQLTMSWPKLQPPNRFPGADVRNLRESLCPSIKIGTFADREWHGPSEVGFRLTQGLRSSLESPLLAITFTRQLLSSFVIPRKCSCKTIRATVCLQLWSTGSTL